MNQQNGSDGVRLAVTSTPPPTPKGDEAAADGTKPAAQDKVLSASANLAQLLPTGSVMAYQALSSSFNNHGECYTSNWWLTVSLVTFLTIFCIFFAFTDSITHKGKVYYGVATRERLRIFNLEEGDSIADDNGKLIGPEKNLTEEQKDVTLKQLKHLTEEQKDVTLKQLKHLTEEQKDVLKQLKKRKLHWLDGVHAFFSSVVFLSVAFSDVGLQKCLFPHAGHDTMELLKNMPLGMSFLSSFVFMIFPTTRHGIGFHGSANITTASPKFDTAKGQNPRDSTNNAASDVANPNKEKANQGTEITPDIENGIPKED